MHVERKKKHKQKQMTCYKQSKNNRWKIPQIKMYAIAT